MFLLNVLSRWILKQTKICSMSGISTNNKLNYVNVTRREAEKQAIEQMTQ